MRPFGLAFLAIAMSFGSVSAQDEMDIAPTVTVSHVTGQAVPRFESLRFAAVNGRTGPSEDHPIRWRYERVGLPVLIVKETRDWRQVRDPDGAEVWMHARTLAPANAALVRRDALLRTGEDAASSAVAHIEAGVLVELQDCGAAACRVRMSGHHGWLDAADLWGAGLSVARAQTATSDRSVEQ